MTTTDRSSLMPQYPHRPIVQAVDRLTEQMKRIVELLAAGQQQDSFVLAPPPVDGVRRCVCGDPLQWYTAPGGGSGWVHAPNPNGIILDAHQPRPADEAQQLRTELDRIYTRPDPTDGNVSLTIGEQLAMAEELERATATVARVRAVRDQWALRTLEHGQVRRLLDDLILVLADPTP